jgi:hypothetical protein
MGEPGTSGVAEGSGGPELDAVPAGSPAWRVDLGRMAAASIGMPCMRAARQVGPTRPVRMTGPAGEGSGTSSHPATIGVVLGPASQT